MLVRFQRLLTSGCLNSLSCLWTIPAAHLLFKESDLAIQSLQHDKSSERGQNTGAFRQESTVGTDATV